MAGFGAHWARQLSLERLSIRDKEDYRRGTEKHALYTLNKHHTARNSPKSFSPGPVQRR
jgi:hypothetical protein